MKVLHIYKTFLPETRGGGEQVIYTLCKGLEKFGVKSKVLCLSADPAKSVSNYNGIEVIRYPYTINVASCPISIKLLFNFRKEAEWADIIYYHYPWPFGDILSLTLLGSRKQVVTYHSDIVKQKILKFLYYPIEQIFLSNVDKIFATSPQYAATSSNLKNFAEKTIIIPLSTDLKLYPKPDKNKCKKIKEKFGDFILFIGQLRYYKGLHLLIEAAKDLDTNIVIIGKGNEETKLNEMASSLKNVHFLGQLEEQDKVNYLESCYAFILPSHLRSEAFGVSLIEATMFGKPLISCKIETGVEYINDNGNTGLVVQPDPMSIRHGINTLINDKKLAKKMGKNARDRYHKLFTSDIMAEQIFKCLKSL